MCIVTSFWKREHEVYKLITRKAFTDSTIVSEFGNSTYITREAFLYIPRSQVCTIFGLEEANVDAGHREALAPMSIR